MNQIAITENWLVVKILNYSSKLRLSQLWADNFAEGNGHSGPVPGGQGTPFPMHIRAL